MDVSTPPPPSPVPFIQRLSLTRSSSGVAFALMVLSPCLFGCDKSSYLGSPELESVDAPELEEVVGFDTLSLQLEARDGFAFFKSFDEYYTTRGILEQASYEAIEYLCHSQGYTSMLETVYSSRPNGSASSTLSLFRGEDPFGNADLQGAPSSIAALLNQHGLVRIADSVLFQSFDLVVVGSYVNWSTLVDAIEQGTDLRNGPWRVAYDGRPAMSSRTRRYAPGKCGHDQGFTDDYSYQHKNDDGDRRHAMYVKFQIEPSVGSGSGAHRQKFFYRSVSYKGRSNKYRTHHRMNYDIHVSMADDPSRTFNYSGYRQTNPNKSSERTKDFQTVVPLTGLPTVCRDLNACPYSQQFYKIVDFNTRYGSQSIGAGTWGSHRGMGAHNEIVWRCL